jgi:hypothetical protein
MNIVGEGFAKEIIDQIDTRQKLKGKRDRNPGGNPEWLVWQNGNTGWVKMISSIDVDPEQKYFTTGSTVVTQLGKPPGYDNYLRVGDSNTPVYFSGRGSVASNPELNLTRGSSNASLAKSNILMGGIYTPFNDENNNYLQAGISRNGSFQNTNAYGFGGLEFGLQPIPGITSFNIRSENRGSIRTATIGIRAYNKVQFDIINTLYMSLGYTMLIEWGNTMYYDNNEQFQSNNQYSLQDEFLLGQPKWTGLLKLMKEKRAASNGNYDAALGRVVNFNWKLNKDMSYDITVTLFTVGDIIESLKINTLSNNFVSNIKFPIRSTTTTVNSNQPPTNPLSALSISGLFNAINGSINTSTPLGQVADISNYANSHDIGALLYQHKQNLDANGIQSTINKTTRFLKDKDIVTDISQTFSNISDPKNVQSQTVYYMHLGYFLFLLEKYIIPNINGDDKLKSIKIDYNISSNIISIDPLLVSADPTVCLLSRNITLKPSNTTISFIPEGNKFPFQLKNEDGSKSKEFYGYLMNIYINYNWILNNLNTLVDNEGNVVLIDFLQRLCVDICRATGNYNKIQPVVNNEDLTIRFIDEVALPNRDYFLKKFDLPTNPAHFRMYGYHPTDTTSDSVLEAGIVRDLNLVTTVSPRLVNMLTISAQANSYVIGEDATALSTLTRGLTDRIKEKVYYPGQKTDIATEKNLYEQYTKVIENFISFLKKIGSEPGVPPSWNLNEIEIYLNTNKAFIEYNQAKATLEKQKTDPSAGSAKTGFLPFNLNFTIDGISGINIYQRFIVDTEYLPPNYPANMEFLVIGVTHEIKENQWLTHIDSVAISKNPLNGNFEDTTTEDRQPTMEKIPGKQPTPVKSSTNPVPTLKQAVKDQAEYYFGKYGEGFKCARWTYNIAYKLKEYMDTNSTKAIPFNLQFSANADSDAWRDYVNKLGFYDKVFVGDMNLDQLKAWVNNSTFNYGDILNYYAPGHTAITNMHTQIYTGNIFSTGGSAGKNKNIIPNSAGNSGWSTSTKTNYGTKVVYNNNYTYKVYYFKVKSQYIK